jgi:hypothetical protein
MCTQPVKKDIYLRHVDEIFCPLGLTPHDAAAIQPGPSIPRTFETVSDAEQKVYPKSNTSILAKGLPVGLDDAGECHHFYPGKGLRFCGFLTGQTAQQAAVKTRGSIVLRIDGVTDTDNDRGKEVYCGGPNIFSLTQQKGGALIGQVRYVQNGRAAVAFRGVDDKRPPNLII